MLVRKSSLQKPRLARLRRRAFDAVFFSLVAFALGALEVFARGTKSDLEDLWAALVLIAVVWVAALGIRLRFPGLWAGAVAALVRVGRLLAQAKIKVGVDLRRTPPVPCRFPALVSVPLAIVLALCTALVWTMEAWPGSARELARRISALAGLAGLTVLWSALVCGIVFAHSIPLILLAEKLFNSPKWSERRHRVCTAIALAMSVVTAVGTFFLPQWVPLSILAVCMLLLLSTLAVPSARSLSILWRPEGRPAPPASMSWAAWAGSGKLFVFGIIVALVLLSRGDRIAGTASSATVATAFLGLVFAWSSAQALTWWTAVFATESVVTHRRDPARRPGPVESEATAELPHPAHLRARKELYAGLERLFDAAAERTFKKGGGFWLAPHLWFITHLSRDVDEAESPFIGPPYHKVLSRAARHHLHVVLEALEVDLVYVEDGVGIRRLKRVLSILFDHFDMFGPCRLTNEVHFFGLPGVRVMVDDYVLDEPFRTSDYDEPNFDELGRARILLVFREHGGDEEREEEPQGSDHRPRPVLLPT